jgi:hypothetical protein
MPFGERTLSIDFECIDHMLVIQTSSGQVRKLELAPRKVCDFHDALFKELANLDVRVRINPTPQECPVTTLFTNDVEHATYDRRQAHDFWEALRLVEPVFQKFRAGFRGKCSPVHFFWGAFDLAVSRFNGKRAPLRKARVDRDAYDEEVISLGFWPGDPWTGKTGALFYSYTVPEPTGLPEARVRPDKASFSPELKEFVLPYEDVRRSSDPARMILEFAESTYDTGATLAKWNKEALAYP